MNYAIGISRACSIQLVATMLAAMMAEPGSGLWLMVQGLSAGGGARIMKRPFWQCGLHLVFLPLVFKVEQFGLPAWIYLLGLILTWVFGRNVIDERVPFYRSMPQVAKILADWLPPDVIVLEAGCADARLALQLIRLRPDIRVSALENAWGSYLLAWCRWRLNGRPGQMILSCSSFWQEDWGCYDVVYVFLSPAVMGKVWQKFKQEGRPGSLLISNTFEVPSQVPKHSLSLGGSLQTELLIWRHAYGA